MILLDSVNKLIENTVLERLRAEKPIAVEFKVADFDGGRYHIWTPEANKSELNISFTSVAAEALLKNGGTEELKKLYGPAFVSAENGYAVTIQYTVDGIAEAEHAKIANQAGLLKTTLYGAPIVVACGKLESGGGGGMIDIPLRSQQERMWIKQDQKDRVTVVFSIAFTDTDDVVFGKVFLQEFKKSVAGAPAVDFRFDPPGELSTASNVPKGKNIGYVSFVLFDRHYTGPAKQKSATILPSFRNYLHYHIKCAKSHLHTRMRNRVEESIKILNRAKQEDIQPKEKKTAAGKTFKRQ
jgi:actin related protein 2/3 complex subunit 2